MERTYLSNAKVKEKWASSKLCLEEEEDGNSCEISWPAKNYSCSFCRREFRSAQALGGHMNVHRRDRARLRLLPSWISENSFTFSSPKLTSHPNPNPNPSLNHNPNSSSPNFSPFSYKHHSFSSSTSLTRQSSPFLASADAEKTSLASFSGSRERDLAKRKSTVGDSKGFGRKTEFDQVPKKEKIVSLDLKMGFLKDQKDDVDLELRLGYV